MPAKRKFISHDFDISYEEIEKGWKMPYSHFHSHYEIYILLSGERSILVGQNTYATPSGSAALFPCDIPHQSFGDTDFSGICIHFSLDFLNRYFKAGVVKQLLSVFESPVIILPKDLQAHLLTITRHFDWQDTDNYLLLAQLLHDLGECHRAQTNIPVPPPASKEAATAEQILEYIHANYTMISTVANIAESLSISESYVYQVVKEHTGMTPKQYINTLRVRHAKRELEFSNRSLHVIQEICGFHSLSYFMRVFKAQTGMTPSEYRSNF